MLSKTKKILLTIPIAVLILLSVLAVIFAAGTVEAEEDACAADIAWTPYIMIQRSTSGGVSGIDDLYSIASQPVNIEENTSVYCVIAISDSGIKDHVYKFLQSKTKISGELNNITGWTVIDKTNKFVEDGITYYYYDLSPNQSFSGYFYFRREYNVVSGGLSVTNYENYVVPISVNYTISGSEELAIQTVSATVSNGSAYDGTWLSGAITFIVRTGTAVFDPTKEMISYSLDGGAHYIHVQGTNIIEVKDKPIVDQVIKFYVSNISDTARSEVYGYGEHLGEYRVSMDPYKPEFSVSATTATVDGSEIQYSNGSWTSKAVSFSLNNNSSCCSHIDYLVSVDGRGYVPTTQITTYQNTTKSLKFRAINQAGTTYDYSTVYNINIDRLAPNVRLAAYTVDPDLETNNITKAMSPTTLAGGTVSFGYANGSIEIWIYNRDANGQVIDNASGTVFEYQERINNSYTGNWKPLSVRKVSDSGEQYYVLSASTVEAISVTRTFKFRIRSNAGLVSDERETTFTLIKSAYLIELGEVRAELNSSGWASEKVTVRVSVPTDSKNMGGGNYSEPTTIYYFYYIATNSSDKRDERYSKGEYKSWHSDDGTEVRWWYEFDLIASADSTFSIYAKNAAGKKSANTEITDDKIRIDVLDPEYRLSGYIHPTQSGVTEDQLIYLDMENPGWVNGQIVLKLAVKVGVSGVYVKERMYAVSPDSGEIMRDETGAIIWQDRSQKLDVTDIKEETEMVDESTSVKYTWQYYNITIDISDELTDSQRTYIGTREYRWRVYTNSGRHIDVGFVANIDTSDVIGLTYINAFSDDKEVNVEISGASGQKYIDLSDSHGYAFSVCKDTGFTFKSSIDVDGLESHYRIKYRTFVGDGMTGEELLTYAGSLSLESFEVINAADSLMQYIPTGSRGDIYLAIFIESTARDFKGSMIGAGPYVLKLHFDAVTLVIDYDLSVIQLKGEDEIDVTANMQSNNWVTGTLNVKIEVKSDNNGGLKLDSGYTFWYMPVKTLGEELPDSGWINVADNAANSVEFDYDNNCCLFKLAYNDASNIGYMAVSVCNGAGFRSKQRAMSVMQIRIDNTTPDVDEGIIYSAGSSTSVEGVRNERASGDIITIGSTNVQIVNYYSTREIQLSGIDTSATNSRAERAPIYLYYKYIGNTIDTVTEVSFPDGAFTQVEDTSIKVFENAGITLGEQYRTVYYALYACNAVGKYDPDSGDSSNSQIRLKSIYKFVYDPSTLTGSMSCDEGSGFYSEQTGMFTYLWQQQAIIYVNAAGSGDIQGASEYIQYQFTIDGDYWYNYQDTGEEKWYTSGSETMLVFSPELLKLYEDAAGVQTFKNGVNGEFLFRARNKSGAVIEFDKVYIAMEYQQPVYKIKLTDHLGGEYTGADPDLDIAAEDKYWTSGPVTISIIIDEENTPASGVTFFYYLIYNNGTNTISTKEEGTYGKKITNYSLFSTDTLDGFNYNCDAILVINAVANSGSTDPVEMTRRISVDQQIPEFTLTGKAYNRESNQDSEPFINKGWTNRDTVDVSRNIIANNVSKVTYKYYVTNKESTAAGGTETSWSTEEGAISRSESCIFTVIATTQSGLTYTETFEINIDTTKPIIRFDGGINVIEGEEYFIDLRVYVEEANIEICEYITIKEETRGFAFDPRGYILSTSSVDNSIRYEKLTGEPYRGYVKVYVKDYAGNTATIYFYVLPFRLTVNNLTLTDEDSAQIEAYDEMLSKAKIYMESSRVSYFQNLISRLRDRKGTLEKEINGYRDYLEKLSNRTSFELRSDYAEMFTYMETYKNYAEYGQAWIQTAITGDSTSKYYQYFQNFLKQFSKLQAQMDKVTTTEKNVIALPAINMVEREDYEDILRVYDEYKNLTMDQKACFTANLYNKLTDLKEACEVLLLTDEESGVAIDGDFAPGASITVTEFDSTTDTFNNAQAMLAGTVSQNQPRTVVSVHRVALDGAYAQTTASDIEVTLPIAEDYRDYIYFTVYELSDDGSVKLIKNTEIQPDGKSIKFNADSLATYVLCVKAVMEESDTSAGVYGSILGLELDKKMILYLIYIGAALFGIILLVVIVNGIRHRRFLNSYNKAYRHSLYRKGVKGVPKGNKWK